MNSHEACSALVGMTRELAAVRAELEDARAERDAYRLIAAQALHHGHAQHLEIERQRKQLAALREELRRYTAAQVTDRRVA